MKKEFAVLSVFFALLVACGDETTIETVTRAGMDVVASADDLPKCTEENEGEYAFVKDDEETRVCVDGKWKPAATPDAGNGTFSCKTEELKDKSGLKIVCNGDSIGVVLNGVDGADGEPGKEGKQGENGDDGAPGSGCSIADRSDTAVVIACGDSTITIDLKVLPPQDTAKADFGQESIFLDSLVGYAQKGPFLKGSAVYLYELDGQSLKQISGPVTGTVMSDDGYFRLPARSFASQYALVVVEGNYRNEVSGEVSDNPIRLNALVDLGNRDSVNVNVLTHLEYERVHHLVTRENYTVEKAKQKAQQEIMKRFHIELDSVMSAENMDIFGSTDADAALLAVSMLLQGDSSSLALSALLNEMSNAISETGKLTSARADSVFATLADWALDMNCSYFFEILDGYYYPSRSKLENLRRIVSEWELNKTLPDYEKYIRRFFSVESGLGVCGSDSVPIGFVKNVTNIFSKKFYASDYSNVDNTYVRFICKEKDGVKNWLVASDIEMDTATWGHDYAEGDVRNGNVNTTLTYVYQNDNWRRGSDIDSLVGKKGCVSFRQDTVAYATGMGWFICKNGAWKVAKDIEKDTATWGHNYNEGDVRNGNVNTTLSYVYQNDNWRLGTIIDSLIRIGCVTGIQDTVADVPNTNDWYICKNNTWREAADIEKDTATWGHNYNEGDVRNGKINTNLTYVYQNDNWRLGTELDSLLVNVSGTACLTNWDTSAVKLNDVYYVCTPQTTGNVVRKWVVAPDVYNDTYEERSECTVEGEYADGAFLSGRVNTDVVYVCDNGEFRQAKTIEINGGKSCITYNRDEYYVLDKDQNGNKQYSFYKCTDDGWMFTLDTLNKDEITDSRDGKTYKTIGIKTQMWMAENMDIDYKIKPLDGDSIIYGSQIRSGCDSCGHFYTWAAAMDSAGVWSTNSKDCGVGVDCMQIDPVRGVCPEGWHVPSEDEWVTLFDAVGGSNIAGMELKSTSGWGSGNGTGDYSFAVLPTSSYGGIAYASFWSTKKHYDYAIMISFSSDEISAHTYGNPRDGRLPVRCLKDPD